MEVQSTDANLRRKQRIVECPECSASSIAHPYEQMNDIRR